jgi:hypothetical protein
MGHKLGDTEQLDVNEGNFHGTVAILRSHSPLDTRRKPIRGAKKIDG